MPRVSADYTDYWIGLIAGISGALVVSLAGESVLLAIGLRPTPQGFFAGSVVSFLALVGIGYGVSWLATSTISSDRYRRIAGWFMAGAVGFLSINIVFMIVLPPDSRFQAIGWVRWALSLGGCTGFVIGVFEARAIERARIAERARIEQQEAEQQIELLEEFASIISHDLRNPLSVAHGQLTLAQDETDCERLDHIEGALERMDVMIKETLQLARQGQVVKETEPVELETHIDHCWATTDTANAELLAETLPTIEADPERLRHVFENLLGNAVEHGGENVTVRLGTLDTGNGFFIEDDGPGIPEDEVENVVEPGFTTTDEGNGFGLWIVDRIVQAHGWELDVTTGMGQTGARFEITHVEFTA